MIKNKKIRSDILALVNNSDFQRETAQIRAKALLDEIVEEIPKYKWNYVAQRIIRNITFATFGLENILRDNTDEADEIFVAARKYALIWEALAKLGEVVKRKTALMNAAVNYELAGYQANAMCIAKLFDPNFFKKIKPSLIDLCSLFLQRRFLHLKKLCKNAQIEPKNKTKLNNSLIEDIAFGLVGKAFWYIVIFFLRGDKIAFKKSNKIFKNAEKFFVSLNLVEESNLVRSIRSLLPIMRKRSIWTILLNFAPNLPKWDRYLKLLARGLGFDIFRGRSISELWRSQILSIENGILEMDSNKIVKMPTSAGKTRIAELAMVYTLVKSPGAKCLYIAPYRALVSELYQSFLNLFRDLGYRVCSISGTYESDEFEEILFFETDVLVTTPEKLDLLLRAYPDFLDKVHLIVFDEAHIVHNRGRGIKFELLLTRLKRKQPNIKFLTLSAVFPQETLEDFAKWLKANRENDLLISDWRPSIQRYAKFEWRGESGTIQYVPERDFQLLEEFVPGVIKQQEFRYRNPETGRINRRRFPEKNNKSQMAAELAFKFAELGPVLIFCTQTPYVESVAKALINRIKLNFLTGKDVPHYFQESKDKCSYILSKEWLGKEHLLTKSLKNGITLHHGRLPDVIRTSIEKDFRRKKIQVIIATNTLAQGVNLPISTIIIHSCRRYIENVSERISAMDYWNIAGRAGRAGEETTGLIIHIKINERDEKDFQYYKKHRENVEPIRGALFQSLIDLIQNRISEEKFITELDPEILALLVEESPKALSMNLIQEILNESLVQFQISRTSYSIEKLNQIFLKVVNRIKTIIHDPEFLATYSSTGLSSNSCRLIQNHIEENEEDIRNLLLNGKLNQLEDIINLFLDICLTIPEIQPYREFEGSYSNLLKIWVEGTEIQDLMVEYKDQAGSYESLGQFIDDLFRYRLPWGISSYIRIAIKTLKIDREKLSDFMKFFPSMVKFGVPDPIACWAMSVGIPSRQAAIEIASSYREFSIKCSYGDFLEWLNTLSYERLQHQFKFRSPLLEDVSRSIFISSVNPILRKFNNIEDFLPCEVEVRGIRYNNRRVVALQVQIGQGVNLIRDYDNTIDRNAIGIYWLNQHLGYVPHEIAQILAPELDTGIFLDAEIVGIDKSVPVPKIKIKIFKI